MATMEYATQVNKLMEIIRKNKECHRFNWSYHIYVDNGEIQAEKRISVWVAHKYEETIPKVWECLVSLSLPMEWKNCRWTNDGLSKKSATDEFLSVEGNSINFQGAFLEVQDPGLAAPLEKVGIHLKDGLLLSLHNQKCQPFTYDPDTLEKHFQNDNNSDNDKQDPDQNTTAAAKDVMPIGRNIHVEATIESESFQPFQPLLFFPQNDENDKTQDFGSVFFGLLKSKISRRQNIYWEISNHTFFLSSPFQLHHSKAKGANNWHTVSVSQDINCFPGQTGQHVPGAYFEFMVDAVGLPSGIVYVYHDSGNVEVSNADIGDEYIFNQNRARVRYPTSNRSKLDENTNFLKDKAVDHPFGMGERFFYVGYADLGPKLMNNDSQAVEASQLPTFFGKLRQLNFDPNSSCGSC